MTNLLLTIRLDALRRNLEQVSDVLNAFEARAAGMAQMRTLLDDRRDSIAVSLDRVESTIQMLARRTNQDSQLLQYFERHLLDNGVRSAPSDVTRIREYLNLAMTELEKMERHEVEITKDLKSSIQKIFASQSTGLVRKIDDVRKQVEQTNNGPGSNSNGKMAQYWSNYSEMLETHSKPRFAEYVDLVGGLALRRHGYDEGVCRMADDVLRKLSAAIYPPWQSWTIPAREEARTKTLASIIRLGFPEWTIWAVPLGAHEFAHVLLSDKEHKRLENYAKKIRQTSAARFRRRQMSRCRDARDEQARATLARAVEAHNERVRQHVATYMADAIATYMIGPAYAYALILLRLDPRSPTENDPRAPGLDRAFVVLEMLGHINKDAGALSPYTGVINQLEEAWSSAVMQNQGQSTRPANEMELRRCVAFVWEYLHDQVDELQYPTAHWTRIGDWPGLLLEGVPSPPIELPDPPDYRDVLNAAWLARARQPSSTKDIEVLAEILWEQIRAYEEPPAPRTGLYGLTPGGLI
jgi:hypothetical protein